MEITGRCVGRRLLGKKFLFLDVEICEAPEEQKVEESKERVHHGLGDHVVREEVKKI